MDKEVLDNFQFDAAVKDVTPINGGLINATWKVATEKENFILQTVNQNVFRKPEDVAENIRMLADYFSEHHPDYLFTAPVVTTSGEDMIVHEGKAYRAFPFITGSHTHAVVQTPQQAEEAAKQFGRFTFLLRNFPQDQLKITLPNFHNLTLRYEQFLDALTNGNGERIDDVADTIDKLKSYSHIAETFETIRKSPEFKERVTHHDTKISNILFDENNHGLCVIDLDTVMPGYFISDVGDMMRTYLSPVSEEESDLSKISVRKNIYEAIRSGYLTEMNGELTEKEVAHFSYSGQFMIYMQALRFITDHINNDVYYGAKYEGHNKVRGENQLRLLEVYQDAFC